MSNDIGASFNTPRLFGHGSILRLLLSWTNAVFKNYSKLPSCKLETLASLDSSIAAFIDNTWQAIRTLDSKYQFEDPPAVLQGLALKEDEYYHFLYEALRSDLSYYETLHLEPHALQSMFQSIYELVQLIKRYKASSGLPQSELINVATNLKNKDFVDRTQQKLQEALVKALRSPYLFSLVISNQDCLDIINLMETNLDIPGTLHTLVDIAQSYGLKENGSGQSGQPQNRSDCIVNLNFEFLNESQKRLRVLEFLSHILSIASQMPFDFDPTTLGLTETSYALELDFLGQTSAEIFKDLKRENMLEALKFCYNSLYTSTLRNSVKKNIYKATLGAKSELSEAAYTLLQKAMKAVVHQYNLELTIKDAYKTNLLLKTSFEPYLFLISLWWVDAKTLLKALTEEPNLVHVLIQNARTEQNLELLIVFFNMYALNSFPEKSMLEIILKSLAYADRSGQLILTDPRLDMYETLANQQLVQAMQENFSIDGLRLSLNGEEEGQNGKHLSLLQPCSNYSRIRSHQPTPSWRRPGAYKCINL